MLRCTNLHEVKANVNRAFLAKLGDHCDNLFKYSLCPVIFRRGPRIVAPGEYLLVLVVGCLLQGEVLLRVIWECFFSWE
jgi:hypothetical protein